MDETAHKRRLDSLLRDLHTAADGLRDLGYRGELSFSLWPDDKSRPGGRSTHSLTARFVLAKGGTTTRKVEPHCFVPERVSGVVEAPWATILPRRYSRRRAASARRLANGQRAGTLGPSPF